MYARPETAAPLSRFWAAVRENLLANGIEASDTLNQAIIGIEAWKKPDLLLSQTCGAPYRDHLHGHVQLVGTPDARLPGCPPGYYQSVFIARDLLTWGEALGLSWAANEAGSQSGNYAALARAPNSLGDPIWSGSHLTSIDMVSGGGAEWAAIDAITWDIAGRLGQTEGLIVWDRSEPTPGLPYITAAGNDPYSIGTAIRAAIDELDQSDRELIGVHDLIDIPAETYLAVPKP